MTENEMIKLAENGDVKAQVALAKGKLFGYRLMISINGGKPNEASDLLFKQGTYWFRQAAELGNEEGQLFIARCYLNGIVFEKDYKEALKWFRKAAEQGNQEAVYGMVIAEQKISEYDRFVSYIDDFFKKNPF